jgi:hypothetical protein
VLLFSKTSMIKLAPFAFALSVHSRATFGSRANSGLIFSPTLEHFATVCIVCAECYNLIKVCSSNCGLFSSEGLSLRGMAMMKVWKTVLV